MIGPITIVTTALAAIFDWRGTPYEVQAPDLQSALDLPLHLGIQHFETKDEAWDAIEADFAKHKHRPIVAGKIQGRKPADSFDIPPIEGPIRVLPIELFAQRDEIYDKHRFARIDWVYKDGHSGQIEPSWVVAPMKRFVLPQRGPRQTPRHFHAYDYYFSPGIYIYRRK